VSVLSCKFAVAHNSMSSTTKVVIISGASSGIGLATAIAFANKGWKTYAGVRNLAKKQNIAEAAKRHQVENLLETLELDVTKQASVQAAVARVFKAEGHIDAVINNAGYGVFGPVESLSESDIRAQYDTNVIGMVRVVQGVLPIMRAQKSGRIVNISSIVGVVSNGYSGLYSSSKFAVEALSQSLREELEPLGIQVSLVQPGFTNTPFMLEKSSLQVKEDVYEKGFAATKKNIDSGLAKGADPSVVGETVFKAATAQKPDFRYQCTPGDAAFVASILKDSHGLQPTQNA